MKRRIRFIDSNGQFCSDRASVFYQIMLFMSHFDV